MRTSRLVLQQRAATMRVDCTATEALLWQELRGSRLGVGFRRQHVLGGRYIADFCAPARRLVVEVDGEYHAARVAADARRDRVVRVPAALVRRDIAAAVALVRAALAAGS